MPAVVWIGEGEFIGEVMSHFWLVGWISRLVVLLSGLIARLLPCVFLCAFSSLLLDGCVRVHQGILVLCTGTIIRTAALMQHPASSIQQPAVSIRPLSLHLTSTLTNHSSGIGTLSDVWSVVSLYSHASGVLVNVKSSR